MIFTPKHVARLLANRINQPHYVEAMISKCVTEAVKAEREACAKLCDAEKERALLHRQDGAALGAEECANLIRARGSK